MIIKGFLQEVAMKWFIEEYTWMTEGRFKDEFPIFNHDHLSSTKGWKIEKIL